MIEYILLSLSWVIVGSVVGSLLNYIFDGGWDERP